MHRHQANGKGRQFLQEEGRDGESLFSWRGPGIHLIMVQEDCGPGEYGKGSMKYLTCKE